MRSHRDHIPDRLGAVVRRGPAATDVGDGPVVRILERERELATCEAALDESVAGRGGMLVVEGPPGIGKSELLQATGELARRKGARVLSARGLEVERELAFGGVRQLLDPVIRATPPEEAARLFSGAASPAGRLFEADAREASATADPAFAMLNALYWVLGSLADREPLVVIVDDAHWVDLPSLRLLDFLCPRIGELPALAVVATRALADDGDAAPLGRLLADPASRVIRPEPLSAAAVAELVRASLGDEPDPAFSAACVDATGGNPFYLTELLRELARRGMQIAVVATARKLAVLCWHLIVKGEDYAYGRPSLLAQKLRALELRAGMHSRRGQRGSTHPSSAASSSGPRGRRRRRASPPRRPRGGRPPWAAAAQPLEGVTDEFTRVLGGVGVEERPQKRREHALLLLARMAEKRLDSAWLSRKQRCRRWWPMGANDGTPVQMWLACWVCGATPVPKECR